MVDDTEDTGLDSIGGNGLDSADSDLLGPQDSPPSDPWEAFFSDPTYGQLPDHLIPVERVELPTERRRREKRDEFFLFAKWPEVDRIALSRCSRSAILLWMHFRCLQSTKGAEAWVWANPSVLLAWGMPQRTYQQALTDLAEAGVIEVDAQPGRKTRVRLKPIEPTTV